MRFADIHGLHDTKKNLLAAVQRQQVAHAQLFSGVEGSALLPMALAYATYLNCENPGPEDACGSCAACSKSLKYIHPDVHFVFPVTGVGEIKNKDAVSKLYLKQWRTFLTTHPYGTISEWIDILGSENKQLNISREESRQIISALTLKTFEGRYKIMLIWLPEYLHPTAANALLKILEEPRPNTVFLLVSVEPEKLLNTILSRTQHIRIPPFSVEELRHILTEQHGIEADKAARLAHLADGSLQAALARQADSEVDLHELFANWMRACFKPAFDQIARLAEDFAGLPKVAQRNLLLYGMGIMREALVAPLQQDSLLRVTGDEATFVEKFSRVLDANQIAVMNEELNKAHYYLERNANPRTVFMNLSIITAQTFKRVTT